MKHGVSVSEMITFARLFAGDCIVAGLCAETVMLGLFFRGLSSTSTMMLVLGASSVVVMQTRAAGMLVHIRSEIRKDVPAREVALVIAYLNDTLHSTTLRMRTVNVVAFVAVIALMANRSVPVEEGVGVGFALLLSATFPFSTLSERSSYLKTLDAFVSEIRLITDANR